MENTQSRLTAATVMVLDRFDNNALLPSIMQYNLLVVLKRIILVTTMESKLLLLMKAVTRMILKLLGMQVPLL